MKKKKLHKEDLSIYNIYSKLVRRMEIKIEKKE